MVRKLRRENAELKRGQFHIEGGVDFFCGRARPATPVVVRFIRAYQGFRVGADGLIWGVEPMCAVLSEHGISIAPSTYYDHVHRNGPSRQDQADALVIDAIYRLRCRSRFMKVLGARKMWVVLRSTGVDVSRCKVERLMAEMGWQGALKRRRVKTTVADPAAARAPDRVKRRFTAAAPNRLWVADFTYCRTRAGWAYTAFVTDVYARKVVGWKVASEMTRQLVIDAINQAIDVRKRSGTVDLTGLIDHSDAGAQYTAVAFTENSQMKGSCPRLGPSAIASTMLWSGRVGQQQLQERTRR